MAAYAAGSMSGNQAHSSYRPPTTRPPFFRRLYTRMSDARGEACRVQCGSTTSARRISRRSDE